MSETRDLLLEIGTEEIPPKSLPQLATALKEKLTACLIAQKLNFNTANWLATPRRLAVKIDQVEIHQAKTPKQQRGPALDQAFDNEGKPTAATLGFAKRCGVTVNELEQLKTKKGTWLVYNTFTAGQHLSDLLPDIIETTLKQLPIAKRMRWGDTDIKFVRPIQWVLLLLGDETVDCDIMGIKAGNKTYGHRFHHPEMLTIATPNKYQATLKQSGKVWADYQERQQAIQSQCQALAEEINGIALIEPDLLDEVTALVELPVCFIGTFNADFLKLPKDVLVTTMQDHQKYFPITDQHGALLPHFIGVANIESTDPDIIKHGNERVIAARLNDALFFWEQDLKHPLADHITALQKVSYQKGLGTLYDRSQRLITIATELADGLQADRNHATRAAELCFCDLLTEMVYELPKLQGTMGRYYAQATGEDDAVAIALEEYYKPRYAGDTLPKTKVGQCLAISEKMDALVGTFAIGKAPSGDKDPFGLRRAGIGLLRILIEGKLDIDIKALISVVAASYPAEINATDHQDHVLDFLTERLRHYYLDKAIGNDVFEAVLAIKPSNPLDFDTRLMAVNQFKTLPVADDLAIMNKRIGNILTKANISIDMPEIDDSLLVESAEIELAKLLQEYQQQLQPLLCDRQYETALTQLSELHEPINQFFDQVMVMCDDTKTRINRLALLKKLSALFLQIADISKLEK